jgi:hypothetical protein
VRSAAGKRCAILVGVTTSNDLSAPAEPSAAEARRIRRPRDMALSLAVLIVPILLIIAVGRFFYGDTTTTTVDPQLALQGAARASMQPIPAAAAPDGWKIVSAQFRDGVLRIGYLDPSDQGVQLVQGTSLDLVNAELGDDARPAGELQAAGTTWSKWDARNGISALTRTAGPTTIIVQGSVPSDQLAVLAAAITK